MARQGGDAEDGTVALRRDQWMAMRAEGSNLMDMDGLGVFS